MFKLEAGKQYVCRDGEVVTLGKCASPRVVWNPAHRVYYFNDILQEIHRPYEWKEHPGDIVAEYVEKKPRKASSPFKKLLAAKKGDVFILKGEKFRVGVSAVEGWIYLTSLERVNGEDYPNIHVRNIDNSHAAMPRQKLVDILKSGGYKIS